MQLWSSKSCLWLVSFLCLEGAPCGQGKLGPGLAVRKRKLELFPLHSREKKEWGTHGPGSFMWYML